MPTEIRLPFPVLLAAAGLLAVVGVALLVTRLAGGDSAKPTRSLLLTGFGPFGPVTENPSWESVRVLDGELIGRTRVWAARLDVVYERAGQQLRAAVERLSPDDVVCFGVTSGGRIALEIVARNEDRCNVADNAGEVRDGLPIRSDGPPLLPSRLPVKALKARLEAGGFDVEFSENAGGYLCNHVFYRLLDEVDERQVAGFVHVPPLGDEWTIERLRDAVRAIVEVLDEEE